MKMFMGTKGVAVAAVVLVMGVFCASTCFGESINATYDLQGANWETSDLNVLGSADWVSTPTCLRLTSTSQGQIGTAWYTASKINPTHDWQIQYYWKFTGATNTGGDGLGMTIQPFGTDQNVTFNYAKSASGCLGIGIDSYKNGSELSDATCQVYFDGAQIGEFDISNLGGTNLQDDTYYTDIRYNGTTNSLYVGVKNERTTDFITDTYTVDLSTIFNDTTGAWFGFSANTGSATENHDLLQFSVTAEVPEPMTLGLVAAGGVFLVLRRRKK